jgi:cytochrome c oxidase cbb3-type subunit 1
MTTPSTHHTPDTQQTLVSYRLVEWHFAIAVFYSLIVVLAGMSYAMQFVNLYPFAGAEFLSPGRVRMTHTMAVAYGFLANGFFAVVYYVLPKLTGYRVLSERLGIVLFGLYNAAVIGSEVLILGGFAQGIEWAETPVILDVPIALVVVAMVVNFLAPVWKARHKSFYVTVWYVTAALVWTPLVYVMGNFLPQYWLPGTGGATITSMYIHDLVGLFVTPMGVGLIYYLLPVLLKKPIYSHALSLTGFWGLAFFYPLNSAHHYLFSPIPMWTQYASVVASIGVHVVVYTVIFNFFATMAGDWMQALRQIPVRFIILGSICYLVTCMQCAVQVTMSAQEIIHFTDWVPGHAHLVLLGTFSSWLFAWMYYLLPRLWKTELYSKTLAEWHFWLLAIGVWTMWGSLLAAGVMQGYMWKQLVPFVDTVHATKPFWWTRILTGVPILVSEFLFAINIYLTWKHRETQGAGVRLDTPLVPTAPGGILKPALSVSNESLSTSTKPQEAGA